MNFSPRPPRLKPDDRDRRIVEAWRDRPERRRSADNVSPFYSWLLEHQPDLVPPGPGSYGHIATLIEPLIVEPTS